MKPYISDSPAIYDHFLLLSLASASYVALQVYAVTWEAVRSYVRSVHVGCGALRYVAIALGA